MGAACCRLNQNRESKPFCKRISFHSQSSSNGTSNTTTTTTTTTRRSGNRSLSSNQDVRNKQRLHTIKILHSQEQQVAPVAADGSLDDETSRSLKNNNEQSISSDCNIETSADACKEAKGSDSLLLPITEDDDFCPTCLEGYEEDNPKIHTKCKHHYHLACILEWQERSNTCPICDQEMIIEDTC